MWMSKSNEVVSTVVILWDKAEWSDSVRKQLSYRRLGKLNSVVTLVEWLAWISRNTVFEFHE